MAGKGDFPLRSAWLGGTSRNSQLSPTLYKDTAVPGGSDSAALLFRDWFFEASQGAPHNITADGWANAQAFGTSALSGNLALTGAIAANAFGSSALRGTAAVTGVASGSVFGAVSFNATLASAPLVSANGFGSYAIGSAEHQIAVAGSENVNAFGTSQARSTVSPSGIAGAQAFGAVNTSSAISTVGLSSSVGIGSPSVLAGFWFVGAVDADSFGVARVGAPQEHSIGAQEFTNAQAFGMASMYAPPGAPSSPTYFRGLSMSVRQSPAARRPARGGGFVNVQRFGKPRVESLKGRAEREDEIFLLAA